MKGFREANDRLQDEWKVRHTKLEQNRSAHVPYLGYYTSRRH
jgi:hypothetical protein